MSSLGLPLVSLESPEQVLSAESGLVERLRQGEPSSVGEVYDAHHSAVRAFAKRLIGDHGLAEDLVHEVFLSLPRAVRRYRGDASLRSFLISIAINHARHLVRSARRRRAALDRYAQEPLGIHRDPERDARRRELASALTRALDGLPLDQRVAFVLCEVEERTSREAADIVGVPEATIRTRIFHARRKLRAILEAEGIA